ncbi:MAG TPA: hypothetical protein VF761_16665 [Gemmatimonadaceae bacterium]
MPSYPIVDPDAFLTVNRLAILQLLREIPYLDPTQGGTLTFVTDPRTSFDWTTYTPPAMVLAPRGSVLGHAESKQQDGCVFEEDLQWALFVVGRNYALDGSGVADIAPGEPTVEVMLHHARIALYGRVAMLSPRAVKVMPANPPFSSLPLEPTRVVYQMNIRTNWLIQGPVP